MKTEGSLSEMINYLKEKDRLLCYGAGQHGAIVANYLNTIGKKIDFFIESVNTRETRRFNIPIECVSNFAFSPNDGLIISVAERFHAEIKSTLDKYYNGDCFFVADRTIDEIQTIAASKNAALKETKRGNRCFILGMGPSILEMDLKKLKDETVFSCSWCGLLDEYNIISPDIYVSPTTLFDGIDERDKRDEYARLKYSCLDGMISSQKIFLDSNDKPLVDAFGFFKDKDVYYLNQAGDWFSDLDYCDLSNRTPAIQTATVMMLKIAIYMGFSDIYLIGTEHDLVKKEYKHSYDISRLNEMGYCELYKIVSGFNRIVDKEWKNLNKLYALYRMFDEYNKLKINALDRCINIFNATRGGDLDVFERVDYDSLF